VRTFGADSIDVERIFSGPPSRDSVLRDGISCREPFVRPEKRHCALTLSVVAAVPVHPTSLRSTIDSRVDPTPAVTFDQTAAKRLAPRRFSEP
jgi:hypothetical protein